MSANLVVWLAVAAGGATGAVARFALVSWFIQFAGKDFPWGTLSVNLIGSFLIGVLALLFLEKLPGLVELRALLIIGFLGSFTTFSAFSWEALEMLQAGLWQKAAVYMAASLIGCLIAVGLGFFITKQFI